MTTDAKITYAEAEAYLNKHEIRKLFEELTAVLIYKRPEKPLQFLQKVLQLKIEQGVIPTPKGKPGTADSSTATSKKQSNPSSPAVSARSARSSSNKDLSGSRKSSAKKASQVEKETRASQDKAATSENEARGHSQFTITPLPNDDLLDDEDDVDHSGEVEEELKGLNSRVRPDSPQEEEKHVEARTTKARPNTVSEEAAQRGRKQRDNILEQVDAYDNEDDEDSNENIRSEEIRKKTRIEEVEETSPQRPISRVEKRPQSRAATAPSEEDTPRGFRNRQKNHLDFD